MMLNTHLDVFQVAGGADELFYCLLQRAVQLRGWAPARAHCMQAAVRQSVQGIGGRVPISCS
jgi:hypothetical protein